MKVKINDNKEINATFLRIDVNLFNKDKSRVRLFISDNINVMQYIKIGEKNKIECWDDIHGYHYIIESDTKFIKEFYDDMIAPQYSCDNYLYTVQFMGDIKLTTLKYHRAIILDLIPTFKCNMNCDYCFQSKHHGDTLLDCPDLNEMYTDIADFLKGMEFKQINLFGGELSIDMERTELANEIVNRYYQTDYTNKKKIFTNAKEFNPEFANFIKEDDLKSLYISVSSLTNKIYDPRHVDIQLMMSNIIKYVSVLGEDRIKCVIIADENTLDYLEETVLKLRTTGVKRFIIKLENELNGNTFKNDSKNIIEKYKNIIKKLSENKDIMLYIRNDHTPSMYIDFLLNREDNENRSVCEMCLCDRNEEDSPVHMGVEDIVFNRKLRLHSIIDDEPIWGALKCEEN